MEYKDILQDLINELEIICKDDPGRMSYHIIPVAKYAKQLAIKFNADIEVVELAAYFHDITKVIGDKDKHHITGAEYAKEFLEKRQFDHKKIDLIYDCVLNHRGSIVSKRNTIEEKIVAAADSIAHIEYPLPMFYKWYKKRQLTIEEGALKIKEKLERSWKKIDIQEVKEELQDKYNFLMEVVSNGEYE